MRDVGRWQVSLAVIGLQRSFSSELLLVRDFAFDRRH